MGGYSLISFLSRFSAIKVVWFGGKDFEVPFYGDAFLLDVKYCFQLRQDDIECGINRLIRSLEYRG